MKKLFATKEVLRITQETRQRIQYWIFNGIVSPADPGAGTGTTRKYSYKNLVEMMLAKELSKAGVDIKIVAQVVNHLKKGKSDYFGKSSYEVAEGKQSILTFSVEGTTKQSITFLQPELGNLEGVLPGLLKSGHSWSLLNLDVLKLDLNNRIEKEMG